MKIIIKLSKEEVRKIVEAYILKEIPVSTESKDVYVTESYGLWEVEMVDQIKEVVDGD